MPPPENTVAEVQKAPLVPSNRIVLAFMIMFAVAFLYILRIILSISIVCMVIPPSPPNSSLTSNSTDDDYHVTSVDEFWTTTTSSVTDTSSVRPKGNRGEFAWSRKFQGVIMSSYFYGYGMTQILGGVLSGKFGAKHVLGVGLFISAVLTLITPAATRIPYHGAYLLVAIRVALGAAGGVFLPSSQSFWGRWAPQLERTLLVSMMFAGITLGNIVALLISPQFCEVELDNGWPWAFYSTGIACMVLFVCWQFLVYSSPDEHPRISPLERDYVKASTGGNKSSQRPPVPWKGILTSPAVWAILVAQTCNTWFLFTSIMLPLYMKDVLRYNIKENGMFLCFPYFVDMFTMPLAGVVADKLRQKKIFRTIVVRKIFQTISCVGSATLLVILSFMDYDRRYVAVALLTMIYPIQNLCRSGYGVNPQDIAPRFSGEIFGITTTSGTISGIISPVVVGLLTQNGTRAEWQMVFFISSGFFLFGGVFFFIFGRGEIQPWAITEKPVELQLMSNGGEQGLVPYEDSLDTKPKNGSSAQIAPLSRSEKA